MVRRAALHDLQRRVDKDERARRRQHRAHRHQHRPKGAAEQAEDSEGSRADDERKRGEDGVLRVYGDGAHAGNLPLVAPRLGHLLEVGPRLVQPPARDVAKGVSLDYVEEGRIAVLGEECLDEGAQVPPGGGVGEGRARVKRHPDELKRHRLAIRKERPRDVLTRRAGHGEHHLLQHLVCGGKKRGGKERLRIGGLAGDEDVVRVEQPGAKARLQLPQRQPSWHGSGDQRSELGRVHRIDTGDVQEGQKEQRQQRQHRRRTRHHPPSDELPHVARRRRLRRRRRRRIQECDTPTLARRVRCASAAQTSRSSGSLASVGGDRICCSRVRPERFQRQRRAVQTRRQWLAAAPRAAASAAKPPARIKRAALRANRLDGGILGNPPHSARSLG
mmetsp:Transcript_46833/g.151131  ORF Transcript_46833/g.151131 Transcript_46833/m.151131 type:complete len:389 (-) Transcript_46833:980-2146(-)